MTYHGTDVDSSEEPEALGAAPTLPFRRETRAERAERRLAERARASEPATPSTVVEDHPATSPPGSSPGYTGLEYVFEPHTSSVPPLGQYLRDLWGRRAFMRELSRAKIQKARSRTIFGSLWGIIDPLILSALYILVFTVIREGQRPTEFIPLLIAGIMLFQMVTGAMNEGADSIRGSANLMLNSTFPRALLPITVVYKSLIQFVPVIPVYAVIFWIMPTEPGWNLLLLVPLFAIQVVLSAGIALFTATLVVYFQDVKNMLSYVTRLLFFTSPIIYPLGFVPDEMRRILVWGPLFGLFGSYQTILGGGVPSIGLVLPAAAWALGALVVGAWLFLRHERDFAVHL